MAVRLLWVFGYFGYTLLQFQNIAEKSSSVAAQYCKIENNAMLRKLNNIRLKANDIRARAAERHEYQYND